LALCNVDKERRTVQRPKNTWPEVNTAQLQVIAL
jgi:hypothetical protein